MLVFLMADNADNDVTVFGGCARNLVRLRWWKTQPPKSPLSGGLSTQFPPDKGARGVKNDERWVFCTVSLAETMDTLLPYS